MTFQRLWVFQLNTRRGSYHQLECSLLNNDEWLLVDIGWRFYHITEDGKLKGKYTYCPKKAEYKEKNGMRCMNMFVNTHLFRPNILAVNTRCECYFYKL
jgi:hypothetical protein